MNYIEGREGMEDYNRWSNFSNEELAEVLAPLLDCTLEQAREAVDDPLDYKLFVLMRLSEERRSQL